MSDWSSDVCSSDLRELHVAELTGGKVKVRSLVRGMTNDWRLIGSRGPTLYFITDQYAPRLRVVSIDARHPRRSGTQVVAERGDTLAGGSPVGDRLILAYLSDEIGRASCRERVCQ